MTTRDQIKDKLRQLTPEERALLKRLLELRAKDARAYNEAVGEMMSSLYEFQPVPMRDFLEDPYYLGQFSASIYPKLKEDLIELFEGNYNIAILTGSIGWGKTTFSTIAVVRIIYEILCLKNPAASFGLLDSATIAVLLIGPTKNQVLYTLFDNVYNMIMSVPFFREKVNKKFDLDEGVIDFTDKNLIVMAKSGDDSSALGLNVIAAVIDEANFYDRVGARRVHTLYNVLTTRMRSRYLYHSKSPAKIFLVSSASTFNSFVETKIQELAGDPGVFIRRYSLWDVKTGYYSDEYFYVFVGTRSVSPRVISESSVDYFVKNYQNEVPFGKPVIKVPIDFWEDFQKDIYTALRDLAGYPVLSINPFIPDMNKFYACLVDEKNSLPGGFILEHPFSAVVWEYPDPSFYVDVDKVTKRTEKGRRVPIVNPNAYRFVHIDLGVKNDSCGIAMGHIAGFERGKLFASPIIYIDFMLQIKPQAGHEIYIEDVREIVLKFYDAGFNIVKITFDKFQSLESIQKFKSMGFEAANLSTESFEAYKLLKDLIYAGRLRFYYYDPFIREIISLYLDVNKAKVDHPPEGSKDVADAVCGVVNSIYEYLVDKKVYEVDSGIYDAMYNALLKSNATRLSDGIVVYNDDYIYQYLQKIAQNKF